MGQSDADDATATWAAALRELHEKAGRPAGETIVRQAKSQTPPVAVSTSSWSDWLNGKNVPSNARAGAWLIAFLTERARRTSPGFVPQPPEWWEQTRQQALAARRQDKGGRPPKRHPRRSPARHLVGVIPQAADCFQERRTATRLREAVGDGGTVVLAQVLRGMGGVGKTQLAADYARRAWRDEDVDVLVWVTATSASAIVSGYADAAAKLGLPFQPDDSEQAARRFLEWAATADSRWLVVLDDVQDPADLSGWWPPDHPTGRVLLTTRRRDPSLATRRRRVVDVDLFTLEEAREYLTAKLAVHDLVGEQEEIDGLAEDLGRLPLALSQAVPYMVEAGLDCAAYRTELADRRATLADLQPGSLPDDQREIVAAAWSLSIEQADKAHPAGLARPVLHLASVLDPNGIPTAVFTSGPVLAYLSENREDVDEREVIRALRVLHRFNLIDYTSDEESRDIRIHQLIQRATRESLTSDQLTKTAHAAADALVKIWPATEGKPSTRHLGQALRDNTTALTDTTGTALWSRDTKPVAHAVLAKAAASLGEAGQVRAAIARLAYLCDANNEILGVDHVDTLNCRSDVAYWKAEAGDFIDAIYMLESVLDDLLRIMGPDHPKTLTTRHNVAAWKAEVGDVSGAVVELEVLLDDELRVLGSDHPSTLAARHSLAYWKAEAGDVVRALGELEALLDDRLRVLGPDHPDTLINRHNVAYWRGNAGDVAGAVVELEALLDDELRVLGSDHPSTLTTRHNVAAWKGRAGDVAGAVVELEALLDDELRVLGPDHPSTLAARHNLAYWKMMAGDVVGAVRELEVLLDGRLRVLGPEHRDTVATRSALVFWRQKMKEED